LHMGMGIGRKVLAPLCCLLSALYCTCHLTVGSLLPLSFFPNHADRSTNGEDQLAMRRRLGRATSNEAGRFAITENEYGGDAKLVK